MILPKKEVDLFFETFIPLLGYANQYDGQRKQRPLNEARDILYGNPQIFADFLKDNPEKFDQENLDIISGWQRFIKGDFILIKTYKKYGVLLSLGKGQAKAYGVLGLTDSLIDIAEYGLGTYFGNVVLLPWKDQIIWDGLCEIKQVILGHNYMRSFTAVYKKIKQAGEIIEKI